MFWVIDWTTLRWKSCTYIVGEIEFWVFLRAVQTCNLRLNLVQNCSRPYFVPIMKLHSFFGQIDFWKCLRVKKLGLPIQRCYERCFVVVVVVVRHNQRWLQNQISKGRKKTFTPPFRLMVIFPSLWSNPEKKYFFK